MSDAHSNRNNLTLALILVIVAGSAFAVGSLVLTGNGHITYNGHIISFQNNTGTVCLINQTSSCGASSSHGQGIIINNNNRTTFVNVANTTQPNNFTSSLNFYTNPIILSNSHRQITPTNASGTFCLRNQTGHCGTAETITTQFQNLTNNFVYASSTYVNTHINFTMPNRSGGFGLVIFHIVFTDTAGVQNILFQIQDNGIGKQQVSYYSITQNHPIVVTLSYVAQLNGQVIRLMAGSDNGQSTTIYGKQSSVILGTYWTSLEIS